MSESPAGVPVCSVETVDLAPGYAISRLIKGGWQLAGDHGSVERERAVADMLAFPAAGITTFDCADIYRGVEEMIGEFRLRYANRHGADALRRLRIHTKYVPDADSLPPSRAATRAIIERSARRLRQDRLDLVQLHWWRYEVDGLLETALHLKELQDEGRIERLGVTNFDTPHLAALLDAGVSLVALQIQYSLLDRRPEHGMTALLAARGLKLLAYGTLAGGFLTDAWLGRADPGHALANRSLVKYRLIIDAAGGWDLFQELLRTLAGIARRHGVSIANVATRWALDQPAVAAVIVGARPGEREHRRDNLRVFAFALSDPDRDAIAAVTARMRRIPGDCGDEYRRPPFLTAAGDLSHHLDALPRPFEAEAVPGRNDRRRVGSGSVWEGTGGYSRAIRVGDRILVSGTTATHGAGELVCPGDVAGQTVYILDKIAAALGALGGSLEDVVRTRIYLRDASRWEAAARVHGSYFGAVRPANTLVQAALVGEYEVEIEAEAVVA